MRLTGNRSKAGWRRGEIEVVYEHFCDYLRIDVYPRPMPSNRPYPRTGQQRSMPCNSIAIGLIFRIIQGRLWWKPQGD